MNFSLERKLRGFKQIAQEKLQTILFSIPNQKDLIIEPDLIKPLEHVCVASWVKSKGVHKIYKFDQKNVPFGHEKSLVYFISANLLIFKHVLDQIHEHSKQAQSQSGGTHKQYHVIVLPDVYSSFVTLLEEEGLYGLVSLHRFNWDFIYLDECLMSLEVPQAFHQLFVQRDMSILPSVAHSLRVFNMVFGKPELVMTYGTHSEKLLDIIERLEVPGGNSKTAEFNCLLMVDRNKDFPSCLLTPATYSGLLLELFKFRSGELEIQEQSNKINNGKLDIFRVKEEIAKTQQKSKTIIRMNGEHDEIFGDNRYKHFSEASNIVRSQAKALGLEVQNLNNMKLKEMHEYVSKKLPKITELKNKITKHLNACEQIINELAGNFQKLQSLEEDILNYTNRKQIISQIDEILTVDAHKYNTIRLLCLVHLAIGITSDELSTFIRNYCNVFGYKYLYVFLNLANAELLPTVDLTGKTKLLQTFQIPKITNFQQTEFQINANRLKLLTSVTETTNESSPSTQLSPSYVFNGSFIPLVSQLASILLKADSVDDLTTKLGAIERIKIFTNETNDKKTIKQFQQSIKRGDFKDKFPLKQRHLLVFVVGGVTYAEVAACDLISKLTKSKIVIASTHIFSGCDLMVSAF